MLMPTPQHLRLMIGDQSTSALKSDDNSIIEYLVMRYSGNEGYYGGDEYGAIRLVNASPILRNITFQDNRINGVEIPGGNWSTDTWDNTDVVYYVRRSYHSRRKCNDLPAGHDRQVRSVCRAFCQRQK
ncbi:MAG: hypothetical protein R2873_34515 [Caldilineaceae bacterium]